MRVSKSAEGAPNQSARDVWGTPWQTGKRDPPTLSAHLRISTQPQRLRSEAAETLPRVCQEPELPTPTGCGTPSALSGARFAVYPERKSGGGAPRSSPAGAHRIPASADHGPGWLSRSRAGLRGRDARMAGSRGPLLPHSFSPLLSLLGGSPL